MSHLQSLNASARLNDLFVRLRWNRYGLRAYPSSKPMEVLIQYKSESQGDTRSVACEAVKLEKWILENRATCGVVAKLFSMLDRKESSSSAEQPTLFPTAELMPAVKRSMNPNE